MGGGRGKCPFHYLLKRFTFASSSQLTYASYSFFHLDSSFTPAHLYEIKRPLIIIIFLLPCRKLNAVPCLWFRIGHQTTATPTKPSPEKQKGNVLCGEGGKGLPRPVGFHADAVRLPARRGSGSFCPSALSQAPGWTEPLPGGGQAVFGWAVTGVGPSLSLSTFHLGTCSPSVISGELCKNCEVDPFYGWKSEARSIRPRSQREPLRYHELV